MDIIQFYVQMHAPMHVDKYAHSWAQTIVNDHFTGTKGLHNQESFS